MTDVSETPEESEAPALIIPPDIQANLDAIRAEIAAQAEAAQAAVQAEEARVDKLNAAKATCVERCGPVAEVLAASTDAHERAALVELERQVHAEHSDALAQAYLEFSGQREGESNPAASGVVTPLVSAATALGESASDVAPV
jgi:hypothetical protein